jgi:hypothetical protein
MRLIEIRSFGSPFSTPELTGRKSFRGERREECRRLWIWQTILPTYRSEIEPNGQKPGQCLVNVIHAEFQGFSVMFHRKQNIPLAYFIDDSVAKDLVVRRDEVLRQPLH